MISIGVTRWVHPLRESMCDGRRNRFCRSHLTVSCTCDLTSPVWPPLSVENDVWHADTLWQEADVLHQLGPSSSTVGKWGNRFPFPTSPQTPAIYLLTFTSVLWCWTTTECLSELQRVFIPSSSCCDATDTLTEMCHCPRHLEASVDGQMDESTKEHEQKNKNNDCSLTWTARKTSDPGSHLIQVTSPCSVNAAHDPV